MSGESQYELDFGGRETCKSYFDVYLQAKCSEEKEASGQRSLMEFMTVMRMVTW